LDVPHRLVDLVGEDGAVSDPTAVVFQVHGGVCFNFHGAFFWRVLSQSYFFFPVFISFR